jgi:hypothetical protein
MTHYRNKEVWYFIRQDTLDEGTNISNNSTIKWFWPTLYASFIYSTHRDCSLYVKLLFNEAISTKKFTKMIVLVLENTNNLPYITEIINGVDNIQK